MTTRPEPDDVDVARDATYHRAPEALRARIRATLAERATPRPRERWWRFGGFATAFAATFAIAWTLGLMHARGLDDDLVARDAVSAHVRSLMGEGRLNDVVSTDQHTVKPWFAGRVDFAPQVVDLAGAGFPLAGGRVDDVDGHAVAAVTYRRRQHVINVFEWPVADARDTAPRMSTVRGHSVAQWTHNGIAFCAVSDVAAADLEQLARELARA